ncbi:hypothetical protein GGI20_000767 [Coemansia sp. BCRC 34301]|nr:hypothetical protein GGI20_000767 [Coemansia sp. BCRC 34301]
MVRLFVAHIPGGNGAAVDLDIDIDIDMDEDVRSGSDQDDGSGDRRPVLSSGLHAEAATAPGGSRQLLHGHSLSDSQISPIRSSTALALSPSQAADLSSVAATQLDRPLLDARLQQLLLLRVNEIQRFCDTLLQVQVQHESKIRSLEATVRRFSDVSSPLSSHQLTPTTATAVGPASAAMHLVSAAVSPPLHHHYHQHQHQREMMAPPLAGSPSGRSDLRRAHHLPTIQAPMSIPPILPKTIRRSSDAIPTADDMAARQQYLDPMLPPPQPAAAYQQSHSAFAAVGSERKAPAQMSTGMNQQHGSLPPLSLAAPQHTRHYPQPQASAPSIRHQQAYHRGASSSFCGGSDYVSPKLARKMSPPPTLPSLAAVGGSQAHSQRHHHRSLGSGGGSRPQHAHHVSGGSRRGSVALAMSAEGDRGAASGLYSAAGGDARLQQQRQFLPPFSAPSSASSRRASVGPSAFGYPAVAAPAGGATAADIGQHYGGGQAGAPPSHPPALHAPGYPSMVRTKRPRDAESGDELIGEGPGLSAPGGEAATLSHMQPPHLHLARHSHPAYAPHHQHTMLPPIRTSEGSQHITSPGLARPATGASLHLVSPSAIAFAPSGHTEDKDKGKGVASELVVSDSIGITQAARSGRDAQPTQSWLASQRHYKTALLHLLSLESFYPSDMAMLNMFRALGDFTPEQVEVHSSTLLSWARGWLRYSRNAVIRSTLDNKAREPIKQLAETLQHDLHTDVDFTTPENLRRCTLLRLIYFQWQAAGKLGSKSNSIYRDYESRLREIEALPTVEDQERDWEEILREEQKLRLDIIREARVRSGESAIQPRVRVRPEQMYQSRIQMNVAPPSSQHPVSAPLLPPPPMSSMAIGQPSLELAHGTSAMQQLSLSRRQSADYLVSAQSPTPGPSHHYPQQQQHYQGPPLPSPAHLHFRQQYQQAQHPPPPQQYPRSLSYRHHHQSQVQQMHPHYRSRELPMREPDGSGAQPEGMDNESDLSVNLSPEP